ncbi:hypothetical protein DFH94DRAFT_705191, partial [Russula ochroleuca]
MIMLSGPSARVGGRSLCSRSTRTAEPWIPGPPATEESSCMIPGHHHERTEGHQWVAAANAPTCQHRHSKSNTLLLVFYHSYPIRRTNSQRERETRPISEITPRPAPLEFQTTQNRLTRVVRSPKSPVPVPIPVHCDLFLNFLSLSCHRFRRANSLSRPFLTHLPCMSSASPYTR